MSSVPVSERIDPAAKEHARAEWRTVLRHRWPLRLMHWINLACMLALVGSGLQVFNAHPALYWGEVSTFDAPAFATEAMRGSDGKGRGITRIGDLRIDTTGVLGVSPRSSDGRMVRRGFPEWATIPGAKSLALGRRWHFFFAWAWVINGACYLLWSLVTRHLRDDLAMRARDWREVPRSFVAHLRFQHPVGDAATRYNPLQKLAYLGVVFVLAPLAVVTGLSMSPQLDSLMGGFIHVIGGRQSARTLHFIAMSLFVLFTVVHVLMVVYAGPVNVLRSMITGRFRVRQPRPGPSRNATMPELPRADRRGFLRLALAAGTGALAGCDALSRRDGFVDMLGLAEPLNQGVQRFLSGNRLAREYPARMISPVFRPNGSTDPRTPEYLALKSDGFASYRLRVRGMVEQPLEFSLAALRALPTRTQITRHDCVEGWSVIGQWSGVPMAHLLGLARLRPGARYVVFHCFDDLDGSGSRYYESVDLQDALHPQTIVAHALNGAPLPVANGAPVRMRIERKLGYKQPKYVHTIEVVDAYAALGGGRGGYWEDKGYDWYGGI